MLRHLSRVTIAVVIFTVGEAVLAQAPEAGKAPSPAPQADKDVPAKLDTSRSKTKDNTENFLLPVPSEIVSRIRRTEYGKNLSATVNIRPRKFDKLQPWQQSLALGVAISDVLLALEASPKAKVLVGLDNVIAGMQALKFPAVKIKEVADLREQFAVDKLSVQGLSRGFDSLRADLLSLGSLLLGSQNYGLLIVGAWSSGAHATALIARNQPKALDDLEVLKVRKVVETFIRLVGTKAEVSDVARNLNRLLPITTTGRVTPPTKTEAAVIESVTAEILALIPA